ncbi:Fibrocystin-L-like protein [Rhodotorula diobovata]|uniref:Fibrocystin-L-like protein n=1 Tax=Rhodotorula diobovata TaxID=5288 RepID=A0A5C5FSA7_9BASI|nr:Fibrocystin-L-like protein [Rhodotorula diobovata]
MVSASSLFSLLVASSAGLVVARPSTDVFVTHSVRQLAKRATPASQSSYLSDIFGSVAPGSPCEDTCTTGLDTLTACSDMSDQASIAACACSAVSLGNLRSCASCVSTTTTSAQNATSVVEAYNAFVDLCTSEGLAQVTGTVAVGASTKPLSSASATATRQLAASSGSVSDSESTAHATYNPSAAPVSTASVPALVASGSIASSARAVASSQAAASAGATSGAGRFAAQTISALAAAAVGFVVLA